MVSKKPKLEMLEPPAAAVKKSSMPTEAPLAMAFPPLIALSSMAPDNMAEEGGELPM